MIMNISITVLGGAYDKVVLTVLQDWKHDMLTIMQALYQEKEGFQEAREQPENMANAIFARIYYTISLLWLHDFFWMRGFGEPSGNKEAIAMTSEQKEARQKLLELTLSSEEAAKHLQGEDGLHFPPKNRVLQAMVRKDMLHMGHSAWEQDAYVVEDLAAQSAQKDSDVLQLIRKELGESQTKMVESEQRILELQRLVQSLAQNTCGNGIYKPTAADENRLREAVKIERYS